MKQQVILNPTKISPNCLIEKRNRLSNEISRYWDVVLTENVIKKGASRNYDIKGVLNMIRSFYDQLIYVKLQIQCMNMGISIKDLPANANVINIYTLSALREYYTKLDEMKKDGRTINPRVKAKYGKKRLSVTEEVTRDFVVLKQKELNLEISSYLKNIADFNDSLSVETPDVAPKYLVA